MFFKFGFSSKYLTTQRSGFIGEYCRSISVNITLNRRNSFVWILLHCNFFVKRYDHLTGDCCTVSHENLSIKT